MSNSSFQMSSFTSIDDKLVMMGETQVTFSFSSAYATTILVEVWTEDDQGASYSSSQTTATDGVNEPSLTFDDFPPSANLHYRITVTGEDGSENTVQLSIDW
jgi:hypothetical protein